MKKRILSSLLIILLLLVTGCQSKNNTVSETGSNNFNGTYDASTVKKEKTEKVNNAAKEKAHKGRSLSANVGIGATPAQSLTPVPSNGFSFAIEADPHFDEKCVDSVLNQTVANIISSKPDFLIDLGDTYMYEKLGKTPADREYRKKLVDKYFSKFRNIPIKMVSGNHDVPINTGEGNYYTFTYKNAQFIVLDPYAFSKKSVGKGGGWATTLGKTQYDWLKNILADSKSDFKFVFIHNLTGGISKASRGGAEAAELYEWGGKNENGIDEFSKMRPDWDMPIHDLLVKYGIDAVFHGHDHFYAKQEKDGMIYQLVPQPGTPGNSVNDASSYGYESGVFLPSPGYIRVVVSPQKAVIEYIKTESDGKFSIPNVYSIEP